MSAWGLAKRQSYGRDKAKKCVELQNLCRWDQNGVPTRKTLKKLGLETL
jgi:aldehyde:ferredoxin oxidoreductase